MTKILLILGAILIFIFYIISVATRNIIQKEEKDAPVLVIGAIGKFILISWLFYLAAQSRGGYGAELLLVLIVLPFWLISFMFLVSSIVHYPKLKNITYQFRKTAFYLNFAWKKFFISTLSLGLLIFILEIFFDISGHLFYKEVTWNIPHDQFRKQAYHFAHGIELPKKIPAGGFRYYKSNKNHNRNINPHQKFNPSLIEVVRKQYPNPQPFDFRKARFNAITGDSVQKQYFEHLCRTEAGEYIFKKVKQTNGIYQMRPMPKLNTVLMKSPYKFEDPVNWNRLEGNNMGTSTFVYNFIEKFQFFESLDSPEKIAKPFWRRNWEVSTIDQDARENKIWQYRNADKNADPSSSIHLHVKSLKAPEAHYGYTWRGIKRPHDRRYGIAGSELILLDIKNNEVLGFRRGFTMAYTESREFNWRRSTYCPKQTNHLGLIVHSMDKDDASYYFLSQFFENLSSKRKAEHFRHAKRLKE